MKDMFKIAILFAAFMFAIPMIGFIGRDANEAVSAEETAEMTETSEVENPPAESTDPTPAADVFPVLDITSGQVMEIPIKDYIAGAVMAEMPAAYETEALKAQAVAAYTYALRRIRLETENPAPELMGAYISNDSSKFQAFFTPEQGKAFYGSAYDEYRKKIEEAVDAVYPEALYYENEPIAAAFHSVSCGKTENSADVWEVSFPYLVSVESEWDCDAPTFYSEAEFSADEISAAFPDADLNGEKSGLISVDALTTGGYVKRASVGIETYSGQEIRAALGLKSAAFTVSYNEKDEKFVFSVKGSGHGVGMSQYGANCLAKENKTYREILGYYYPETELIAQDYESAVHPSSN